VEARGNRRAIAKLKVANRELQIEKAAVDDFHFAILADLAGAPGYAKSARF
jgi:hypothetical protein